MTTSRKIHPTLFALFTVTIAVSQNVRSEPFSTAFTYQAQLDEGNGPLNGSADLRFELFAVETGSSPVGAAFTVTNLAVSEGLVAVSLDFGVDVFDGGSRWLEVAIRTPHDPGDSAPFTTLSPRQSISPIPYALQTRGIFVNEAGDVSIGVAPNPAIARAAGPGQGQGKLHAEAAPGQLLAIHGNNPATTGDAVGILGSTASPNGRGIEGTGPREGMRGHASDSSGDAVGIKGSTASANGRGMEGTGPREGVRGKASDATGNAVGMKGTTASPDGRGIEGTGPREGMRGEATAISGTALGVCGISASTSGKGIEGRATAQTGITTGVHGITDSPNGVGVLGEGDTEGIRGKANATDGAAVGVCGISASPLGDGVLGHASASSGTNSGVHGKTDSPDGRGVFGEAAGTGTGVLGESFLEGVRGVATWTGGGTGGISRGVAGICASQDGAGVFGHATATSGITAGIMGRCDSPQGRGVYGSGVNEGVRGELNGWFGTAFGVLGLVSGPKVTGVYGEVPSSTPDGYGVHGRSRSNGQGSAGVLAEGNGNGSSPPSAPRAAALEIRNGAITVSGTGARPAGTIEVPSVGWTKIESCNTSNPGPGNHFHKIGDYIDVQLANDLIVIKNTVGGEGSIILATVEVESGEVAPLSYSVHVWDKDPGNAVFRVTAMGHDSGNGSCGAPDSGVRRVVHYQIINPLP